MILLVVDIEALATKIYSQVMVEQKTKISEELFKEYAGIVDENGQIDIERKMEAYVLVQVENAIISSTRILVALLQESFPEKFPKLP